MKQNVYFFTYGLDESYPFRGGWSEVFADNHTDAVTLFRMVHPDLHKGIVNCADVYTLEQFKKTGMLDNGNFGEYTHEFIRLQKVRLSVLEVVE